MIQTIIVSIILLVTAFLVVRHIIRALRADNDCNSCCSCGCSHCPKKEKLEA